MVRFRRDERVMNKDQVHMKTTTAQKVMDRIKEENRWILPVHEYEKQVSKRLRYIGLMIAILFLFSISVSFIFLKPSLVEKSAHTTNSEIVTTIKSTDFAQSFSNLDFTVIKKGTVASIGEPKIYQPDQDRKHQIQLFWILVILGISMITLFMNWLSREQNHNDRT